MLTAQAAFRANEQANVGVEARAGVYYLTSLNRNLKATARYLITNHDGRKAELIIQITIVNTECRMYMYISSVRDELCFSIVITKSEILELPPPDFILPVSQALHVYTCKVSS
jgi:hypothetical protein